MKHSMMWTATLLAARELLGSLTASGRLSDAFSQKKALVYDHNMLIFERTIINSEGTIAPGKHKIELSETIPKHGSPAEVILKVDGKDVAKTTVKRTVPAAFTASETFDVGVDLGSPVSLDYFDLAPFQFDGKIEKIIVKLK